MYKLMISSGFILLMAGLLPVQAQNNMAAVRKVYKLPKLDEHSLIRDSTGKRYDYTAWNNMIASGRYSIKVAELADGKPSLIIARLSKAEREEVLAKLPRPVESPFFKTGSTVKSFRENDINGEYFDLKQLIGKVVVINFWRINHMPSMMDISNLNELVDSYKNDPNVVFLAMAADNIAEVKEFLAATPLKYHIIERGKNISSKYNVEMFPTNLVIDKTGKVQYHSSGYAPSNAYWVAKTIEQIKTM